MKNVTLGGTTRETTVLGFGCSSLMGVNDRKTSLGFLEEAFDAGIRHFDVAPLYGYGQAEACLGEFLTRHRGAVTVTTKYGIPPAANQSLLGVARGIARPLIKLLPGVKQRLAAAAGKVAGGAQRSTFSVDEARASLEHSLRQLQTDHIDLWLLHEARSEYLQNDALLRLLEDAVAEGKIGGFGVGSEGKAMESLMMERPEYCRTVQYEWSVLDPVQPAGGPARIHHGALTHRFREMQQALKADGELSGRWSSVVGADVTDAPMLARLMLKASLVMNDGCVILFSSKSAAHMQGNVLTAGDDSLAGPARRLYELVQQEGVPMSRSVSA